MPPVRPAARDISAMTAKTIRLVAAASLFRAARSGRVAGRSTRSHRVELGDARLAQCKFEAGSIFFVDTHAARQKELAWNQSHFNPRSNNEQKVAASSAAHRTSIVGFCPGRQIEGEFLREIPKAPPATG